MTPAELPAYLEAIKSRVEASAIPVADAIGDAYKEHLVGFTLHESGSHAPVTRTPAAPGRPPAFMNGELAGSVTKSPAIGGGGVAETTVAPHTVYAGTIQWGGVHKKSPGFMALWIRYIGYAEVKARGWLKHAVKIPSYPYMNIAVDETVANGSLERAGIRAFIAAVWGG